HSAWRQSRGDFQDVSQPVHHFRNFWSLAWCCVDLCDLGSAPCDRCHDHTRVGTFTLLSRTCPEALETARRFCLRLLYVDFLPRDFTHRCLLDLWTHLQRRLE